MPSQVIPVSRCFFYENFDPSQGAIRFGTSRPVIFFKGDFMDLKRFYGDSQGFHQSTWTYSLDLRGFYGVILLVGS